MADPDLVEAYERAQREWPDVSLSLNVFQGYAENRIDSQRDPTDQGAADKSADRRLAHASDLYLACACGRGDSVAMQHLNDKIVPQLLVPVRRLDASATFIDEVRRELLERLLVAGPKPAPRINLYAGTSPLVAWGRAVATRIALDLKRKHHREVPLDDEHLEQMERMGGSATNLEMQYIKSLYATEFTAALTAACAALEPRLKTVLRLRFVDELNIDQIGRIYSVHRATIARWIVQARQELWATTRQELEASLQKTLSTSEFQSYIHLVKSQLELSVNILVSTGV